MTFFDYWKKEFDDALQEHIGDQQAAMLDCGRWCAYQGMAGDARIIRESLGGNPPLGKLIAALNDKGIGGGFLSERNGAIVGIYKQCYCPARKEIQEKYPLYCDCTRGWAMTVFKEALGYPVTVELVRTIVRGMIAVSM